MQTLPILAGKVGSTLVTIKDIAKATSLSTSTVSRALNNHPAINKETRQIVLDCVRKLRYQPNRNARNLVNRKNTTIGFMIPDISDSFFSSAAIGVEEIMYRNGHDIVYSNTNRDSKRVLDFLIKAQEWHYSGVFITPDRWDSAIIDQTHAAGMPVISLRRKSPADHPEIPYVDSDHYAGFVEAAEYLVSLGRRSIGLITADTMIYSERQQGYEHVMQLNNLPTRIYCHKQPVHSSQRYEAGYQAMQHLLERFPDITALLTADDRFAIGAMKYLSQVSLRVPEDISIIGCDDRPEGQLYPFQLSTIQQDILGLGRNAAQMMLRMIDDPQYRPASLSLQPRLIIRRTTG